MKKIREVIVVEGSSDVKALKRALGKDVRCYQTHGMGISEKQIKEIKRLSETVGIIIFTDPDYAGKRIRMKILEAVPNAKQAFVDRANALGKGKVGVEHADDQTIIEAIKKAKPEYKNRDDLYTLVDIMENGLMGQEDSKQRRIDLCKNLAIGYCSAKTLLNKLNSYEIARDDFNKAIGEINEKR